METIPPSMWTEARLHNQKSSLLSKSEIIVFDGDSITSRRIGPSRDTWPYLRLTNAERQYPERVDEWLFCNRPDLKTSCKVAAVGGSTCAAMLERFETALAPHQPTLVVFTVGSNDAAHGVSLGTFLHHLTDYCDRVQHLGAKLLYISGMKPCPNLEESLCQRLETCQSYYRAAMDTVVQLGGQVLDIGDEMQARAKALVALYSGHTVYSDGQHFNAIGNHIIAALVLEKLGVLTLSRMDAGGEESSEGALEYVKIKGDAQARANG